MSGSKPYAEKKNKRRRIGGFALVLALVLVMCGLLSFQRVQLEKKQEKVRAEYNAALAEYEGEQERAESLKKLEVYSQTKKFVEDIAREKFGLVYEDEVIFTPEEE